MASKSNKDKLKEFEDKKSQIIELQNNSSLSSNGAKILIQRAADEIWPKNKPCRLS